MKLQAPVAYSSRIQLIPLPNGQTVQTGTVAVVTGWGKTTEGGSTSDILKQASICVQDAKICGSDNNLQICAGIASPVIDTCQGDSGGPLIVLKNKIPLLLGIVSFGPPSCGKTAGAYTRVQYFSDWIYTHTGIEPFIVEYNQTGSIPSIIYGEAEIFMPNLPNHLMQWKVTDNIKITDIQEDHLRLRVISEGEGRIEGYYHQRLIVDQKIILRHNKVEKKWGCRR